MIVCKNCGAENPPADVYCYRCGELLFLDGLGDTHKLDDETGTVTPRRRWGTARFDTDSLLVLSTRDGEDPPLKIAVNGEMVMGRSHGDYQVDVDLNKFNAYDKGVSRQHALLRRQNDTVILVDMNSANSTFLNGQRLVPDQPRILRDGDEIRLGQLILRAHFEDGIRG